MVKPFLTTKPDYQMQEEPKPDYQTYPKPENPKQGFPSFRKSGRINKKDSFNNKDIYKGIQVDEPETENRIEAVEPETGNGNKGKPNTENPNQGFGRMPKSARINKKDFNNNKDIYKGEDLKAVQIFDPIDGDLFGSSTRYTENEILEIFAKEI